MVKVSFSLNWQCLSLFRSSHILLVSHITYHTMALGQYVIVKAWQTSRIVWTKTSCPYLGLTGEERRGEEGRGEERRGEEIVINILELFAVPSLITAVITPVNLPAPLQPLYSCLCLVRKNILFLSCKFLANDHIRKHLLPRWSPQWYGDLVLKRAWLWLVNYYFYIDL